MQKHGILFVKTRNYLQKHASFCLSMVLFVKTQRYFPPKIVPFKGNKCCICGNTTVFLQIVACFCKIDFKILIFQTCFGFPSIHPAKLQSRFLICGLVFDLFNFYVENKVTKHRKCEMYCGFAFTKRFSSCTRCFNNTYCRELNHRPFRQ